MLKFENDVLDGIVGVTVEVERATFHLLGMNPIVHEGVLSPASVRIGDFEGQPLRRHPAITHLCMHQIDHPTFLFIISNRFHQIVQDTKQGFRVVFEDC